LPESLIQTGITTQVQPAAARPSEYPPLPSLTRPRPSNRTIRGIIVGIMGIMAILSLAYAWRTIGDRRSRDPRPRMLTTQARQVMPAIELAALGYLPPETGVVIAVDVTEAERSKVGKGLLSGLRLGNSPLNLNELDKWTGLSLSEIDHVVLGFKVDNRIPPPVVLVVQTRQPYDAAKVRETLKTTRSTQLGSKTVYFFTPAIANKLSFEAVLWSPSDRIVVVTISKGELERIPDRPAAGGNQLPEPLQGIIKERIGKAEIWLAGHVEKWEALGLVLTLLLPKEDIETLTRLRTFGFWLKLDDRVRFDGAVHCVDAASAEALGEKWSRLLVPQGDSLPAELQPVVREFADTYQREVKGDWVTFRAKASPTVMAKPVAEK
jgi:hypothetical protein